MVVKKAGPRFPKFAATAVALAVGDLVTLNSSSQWLKANAAVGTVTVAIGVVTKSCLASGYPEVCRWAYITGYTTSLTKGGQMFLDEGANAGLSKQSGPSTTGDLDQVVGWALTATDVWLEPKVVAKTTAGANVVHA